jgi:hypothetical protein
MEDLINVKPGLAACPAMELFAHLTKAVALIDVSSMHVFHHVSRGRSSVSAPTLAEILPIRAEMLPALGMALVIEVYASALTDGTDEIASMDQSILIIFKTNRFCNHRLW